MARPPDHLACGTSPDIAGSPACTLPERPPARWARLHELLRAEVETSPDEAIVRVAGELDVASAPKLAELLLGGCGDAKRVVVDLSLLSFIDASAVRALLGVREMLESFGNRLMVRNPSTQVQRVLSICGVLDALTGRDG